MFDMKGIITVELEAAEEDKLMEIALENGAEDINTSSGAYEIITDPSDIDNVRQALEDKNIPMVESEVTMIPQNSVKLEKESEASSMLKIMDMLEENDDVQKVYANFDIDDSVLEKLAQEQ